tara:strand:- start:882 stop:1271 length:390 start_codon:yes stop_codon:yes gene_type:complete
MCKIFKKDKDIGQIFYQIEIRQSKEREKLLNWVNNNGGIASIIENRVILEMCPICGTIPLKCLITSRKERCDFCSDFTYSISLNEKNKRKWNSLKIYKKENGWEIPALEIFIEKPTEKGFWHYSRRTLN